jgi:peptide chain release factor 1
LLDKLKLIEERFKELGELLVLPETISDQGKYIKFSKEYKDLQKNN